MHDETGLASPQVKICGLKSVEEAVACAELGADAIGCVFFERSPRFVTDEQARDICRGLPKGVYGVGVFVNEDFENVMGRVERCGLKAVQLHGGESPEMVRRLRDEGVVVIKAFFVNSEPAMDAAELYEASACLVECAGGVLPGGNAMAWDWGAARGLSRKTPLVLAGGLTPDNVSDAIRAAVPAAVDVSSGVEAGPGIKDIGRVQRFIDAVRASGHSPAGRLRVFP